MGSCPGLWGGRDERHGLWDPPVVGASQDTFVQTHSLYSTEGDPTGNQGLAVTMVMCRCGLTHGNK